MSRNPYLRTNKDRIHRKKTFSKNPDRMDSMFKKFEAQFHSTEKIDNGYMDEFNLDNTERSMVEEIQFLIVGMKVEVVVMAMFMMVREAYPLTKAHLDKLKAVKFHLAMENYFARYHEFEDREDNRIMQDGITEFQNQINKQKWCGRCKYFKKHVMKEGKNGSRKKK